MDKISLTLKFKFGTLIAFNNEKYINKNLIRSTAATISSPIRIKINDQYRCITQH